MVERKYKEISVWGAICYSDAYIYDEEKRLAFISLFGRSMVTKAVVASFITLKYLNLKSEGDVSTQLKKPYDKCQFYTANENGLCHKVVIVPDYFDGMQSRIINQDDRDRIFNFIDSSVSTPLKKEWAEWLLQQEIVKSKELYGFGQFKDMTMSGCRLYFAPESEEMDEIVLEGIRNGELN